MSRRLLLLVALWLLGVGPATAQTPWQTGEVLTYKVTLFGLSVGTATMTALDQTSNGERSRIEVRSHVGPFTDIHDTYTSLVDPANWMLRELQARQFQHDVWVHTDFVFDYGAHRLTMTNGPEPTPTANQFEAPLDEPLADGIALIHRLRATAHRPVGATLKMVVDRDRWPLTVDTARTAEMVTLDDTFGGKTVRAIKLSGRGDFEAGYFGPRGPFTVWLSDDAAAVPLRAEIKLRLGSVKLTLIDVRRSGWTP